MLTESTNQARKEAAG